MTLESNKFMKMKRSTNISKNNYGKEGINGKRVK